MNALFILIFILLIIFIHDIYQAKHSIIHNYPIIGHFRYLFEKIGPELRQYFIENNREGLPFNRSQRSYIYASSKKKTTMKDLVQTKTFQTPSTFL